MRLFRLFYLGLFFCVLTVHLTGQVASSKKGSSPEIFFEDVEQAVIRAESFDAREYAKAEMQMADESLAKARTTSQKSARQKALKEALEHLNKAYEIAKIPYIQDYITRLEELYQGVQAKNFSLYAPKEAEMIGQQVQLTKQFLQTESMNEKTRYIYDRTWQNIQNFDETTTKNITMVTNFGAVVRYQYTDKDLQLAQVDSHLAKGDEALQVGQLSVALQSYQDAMTALNKSQINDEFEAKLAEVDRLIFALKSDLEKANRLFIVKADGSLGQLKPFNPETYLASNPLIENPAIPILFDNTYYTDLALTPYDIVNIEDQTPKKIEVAADISDEGLYQQAVSLWEQGLVTRNAGYLDDAKKYLQRSREYLIAFKKDAIARIYTVQKRPQTQDTLWRIAGFKDVYNNPYLWPLLWQRNREQIDNPDLLYPGQKLLVPAID